MNWLSCKLLVSLKSSSNLTVPSTSSSNQKLLDAGSFSFKNPSNSLINRISNSSKPANFAFFACNTAVSINELANCTCSRSPLNCRLLLSSEIISTPVTLNISWIMFSSPFAIPKSGMPSALNLTLFSFIQPYPMS